MASRADYAHQGRVGLRGATQGLLGWARLAVATSFLFLVAIWIAFFWVAGDTPFVLDGTNAFIDCLSRGDFVACGYTGKLDYWGLMSPIGDWSLLQHLPDLASIGLGADGHPARTRILALLSVAGVVSSVILARVVLRRVGQAAWFWGFLLVVLSSPFLWYTRTTAGEALATGLLVCLVAATVLQAPPAVVALAAFGASLTKETAYPFVAALGLLGLVLARRRTGVPMRRHLLGGTAGLAVGIALTTLFNIVRFGRVLNPNFFEADLHTPGISRKLEYSLALLVSPNGVFPFWPAASVLISAACLLPFVFRSGRALDRRPAIVLIAVTACLTLGFASWWTPFGWGGYGPRLSLPWVLPLVLIILVAYGQPLGELVHRLITPSRRLVLVFAGVLAFTLPHVGQMWRPGAIGPFFSQGAGPCDAPWRIGVAKFQACQHELVWSHRPMLLYALHGVRTASGAFTSIVVAVGLGGCLILLREGLAPARPRRP